MSVEDGRMAAPRHVWLNVPAANLDVCKHCGACRRGREYRFPQGETWSSERPTCQRVGLNFGGARALGLMWMRGKA